MGFDNCHDILLAEVVPMQTPADDPLLSRSSAEDIAEAKRVLGLKEQQDAAPGARPAVADLVITGSASASTPGGALDLSALAAPQEQPAPSEQATPPMLSPCTMYYLCMM